VKAKQLLGAQEIQVTERQYFKHKPTVQEVQELGTILPGGAHDLLSTRSRRYKELNLNPQELTEQQVVELLAAEPGLWRRPVVVRGDRAVVGYDHRALEELLS
jgi:Spx/MgsR family transcriptional regulator